MAYKQRFKIDEIRTLGVGSILGSYEPIGTPLVHTAREVNFYNLTDEHLYFSIDGIIDQILVPINNFKLIENSKNKVHDDGYFFSNRTQFYVRSFLGPVKLGSAYVEVFYA